LRPRTYDAAKAERVRGSDQRYSVTLKTIPRRSRVASLANEDEGIDNAATHVNDRKGSRLSTTALLQSSWARDLSDELRRRVLVESSIRTIDAGGSVCRKGEPPEHWIGVLSGLVKVVAVSAQGRSISFMGVPPGGWFGEGTLLKREPRRFDAIALRDSTVAYVPFNTFMLMLESSVSFNHFLLAQINERLGQFVGMVEHNRLLGPDARLAKELADLFNPVLYPGNGSSLPISQEELANLVGLSRQRVNRALRRLERVGLVRAGYRSLTILDLEGLRRFEE
jgi:CRP/FNR family cyclic AMP-dependent transcriptional regulator